MLPLWARVDLGVMAIKDTLHFLTPQNYWSLTIRLFSFTSMTLVGRVLILCKVSVFYSPSKLGQFSLSRTHISNCVYMHQQDSNEKTWKIA